MCRGIIFHYRWCNHTRIYIYHSGRIQNIASGQRLPIRLKGAIIAGVYPSSKYRLAQNDHATEETRNILEACVSCPDYAGCTLHYVDDHCECGKTDWKFDGPAPSTMPKVNPVPIDLATIPLRPPYPNEPSQGGGEVGVSDQRGTSDTEHSGSGGVVWVLIDSG